MSFAASNGTLAAHIHVDGFDQFHRASFNKRKVRAAMRRTGQIVAGRAKMNLSLAGASSNYPLIGKGVLRDSIEMKVSRSGFLVKIMPEKTAGMAEYYPAFLHYGVRRGGSIYRTNGKKNSKRKVRALLTERNARGWLITPRENYIADALQDESSRVRAVLKAGFARALAG